MDTTRLILVVSLGLVSLLIWQAWQQEYGTAPSGREVPVASPEAVEGPADVPTVVSEEQPESPEALQETVQSPLESAQRIYVHTDVLDVEIDTRGGDIRTAKLLKYPSR